MLAASSPERGLSWFSGGGRGEAWRETTAEETTGMALTRSGMPHVLVVDDDPGVRYVTSFILDRAGYEVSAAAGVQEGLDAMSRRSPDVVVTDFTMPDGTGHDILEGARKLPTRPPVIVVSGTAHGSLMTELLSAGASEVLAKPFSPRDLLGAVQALAEQSWADRGLSLAGVNPRRSAGGHRRLSVPKPRSAS